MDKLQQLGASREKIETYRKVVVNSYSRFLFYLSTCAGNLAMTVPISKGLLNQMESQLNELQMANDMQISTMREMIAHLRKEVENHDPQP